MLFTLPCQQIRLHRLVGFQKVFSTLSQQIVKYSGKIEDTYNEIYGLYCILPIKLIEKVMLLYVTKVSLIIILYTTIHSKF